MANKEKKREDLFGIFKSDYAKGFIKKYKWNYLVGIAMLIIIDVVQTDQPLVISEAITAITDGAFTQQVITKTVIRLAAIAAVVFLGRIGWRWFIFGSSRKIEKDMRNDLYDHLQTLDQSFFQEHKAGEIMAYMTSDIETVRMCFAGVIMMGLDTLTIGVSTLYKMITKIDPILSILTFIPLIFVAVVMIFLGSELHKRYAARQKAFSDMADFVQEKLNGIKVIKAFVQEEKERINFDRANRNSQEKNIKEARMQAFMFPFMRMVAGLSMALAIGYGGYIAIKGRIDVGQFSGFIMYLNMLVWPMAAIGRIINILTRGNASMKRLETVLNAKAGIVDIPEAAERSRTEASAAKTAAAAETAAAAVDRHAIAGSIEARDLSFHYPDEDKEVLSHISFRLEKGQTLGIVGRTGSGKTTLVNLLMRIFEPDDNMLFIGENEIHSIPLKQLRSTIGYVPQDNFLFSDTISANIAFGNRENITQQQIEAAAEAACVHDNIVDFADGYDTMVGERGVSLSGGQKQRIAIARALVLDPEILILDDSVSAVDTDTEEKILQHLKQTRAGKTNIIIAHRISTLQNADKIIVIDEGRIAEEGTHDELVAMNGIYADMYNRQLLEKMRKEEYAL